MGVDRDREFGDYYTSRADRMRGAAYLMCGDWHRAEDVVQTAFVRLYLGWHRVNAEGAIEAHDVKTRTAGRATFIEFHLVVPGTMTVATSHHICDRIERALKTALHDAEVLIHVEPEEEAKASGVPVV